MELDIDLTARQEARALARRAGKAQQALEKLDQGALDAIVAAMAAAFEPECAALAKMAVEETGFGNTQDKTEKNLFACKTVLSAIAPMKTKGIPSQYQLAANILLESFYEAHLIYDRLCPEEKEVFASYPIMNLWKSKD